MPALNFQAQFSPGILAMLDKSYAARTGFRPKTTTIRSNRTTPIKKGDTLFLYQGMRSSSCIKLGEAKCHKIQKISITQPGLTPAIVLDGETLSQEKAVSVALSDGFDTVEELVRCIRQIYALPFNGVRIHLCSTYDRKYFCNKSVKKRGYHLQLETTQKTILIRSDQVESAQKDRYIRELSEKHNYGVQIINPLFE